MGNLGASGYFAATLAAAIESWERALTATVQGHLVVALSLALAYVALRSGRLGGVGPGFVRICSLEQSYPAPLDFQFGLTSILMKPRSSAYSSRLMITTSLASRGSSTGCRCRSNTTTPILSLSLCLKKQR